MTARKNAIAIALLLAAAACKKDAGGDAPPGGGTPGPETAAAFCAQLWTTFGERWAACDRGSPAFYAALYDPQWRCADALAAIAAGKATYDRTSAGACLDFVTTASCDALEAHEDGRSPAAACLAAVAGSLGEGAECFTDESCASDACLDTYGSCPSICATRVAPGAPCMSFATPCVPGYQCETTTAATLQTCQPLKAEGARCNGDDECLPGLRCGSASSEPFTPTTCLPRQTSGACGGDPRNPPRNPECAIPYACIGYQCTLPAGPYETCAVSEDCGAGLYCSSGKCVDGVGAGWSCGGIEAQIPCIGSACNLGLGFRCVGWAEGSWCNFSWDCAPSMTCDQDTHQCYTACPEP